MTRMITSRYFIELECEMRRVEDTEQFDPEGCALEIMDALQDEPGAIDPDICVALATGQFIISMSLDAQTAGAALDRASTIARSAIHKTGGFTPNWGEPETVENDFKSRVQLAALIPC